MAGGYLRSNAEDELAEDSRAVIRSTPAETVVDEDGRAWTVKHLPSIVAPPEPDRRRPRLRRAGARRLA
jgi:hypothetical protein